MIDTDKYEGHTRRPWRWYEGARHKALIGVMLFGEDGNNEHPKPADAQLIADAPLILEAYKRLREENKKQSDVLSTLDEMIRKESNHVELMKALEQGLNLPETWKEMVE